MNDSFLLYFLISLAFRRRSESEVMAVWRRYAFRGYVHISTLPYELISRKEVRGTYPSGLVVDRVYAFFKHLVLQQLSKPDI